MEWNTIVSLTARSQVTLPDNQKAVLWENRRRRGALQPFGWIRNWIMGQEENCSNKCQGHSLKANSIRQLQMLIQFALSIKSLSKDQTIIALPAYLLIYIYSRDIYILVTEFSQNSAQRPLFRRGGFSNLAKYFFGDWPKWKVFVASSRSVAQVLYPVSCIQLPWSFALEWLDEKAESNAPLIAPVFGFRVQEVSVWFGRKIAKSLVSGPSQPFIMISLKWSAHLYNFWGKKEVCNFPFLHLS